MPPGPRLALLLAALAGPGSGCSLALNPEIPPDPPRPTPDAGVVADAGGDDAGTRDAGPDAGAGCRSTERLCPAPGQGCCALEWMEIDGADAVGDRLALALDDDGAPAVGFVDTAVRPSRVALAWRASGAWSREASELLEPGAFGVSAGIADRFAVAGLATGATPADGRLGLSARAARRWSRVELEPAARGAAAVIQDASGRPTACFVGDVLGGARALRCWSPADPGSDVFRSTTFASNARPALALGPGPGGASPELVAWVVGRGLVAFALDGGGETLIDRAVPPERPDDGPPLRLALAGGGALRWLYHRDEAGGDEGGRLRRSLGTGPWELGPTPPAPGGRGPHALGVDGDGRPWLCGVTDGQAWLAEPEPDVSWTGPLGDRGRWRGVDLGPATDCALAFGPDGGWLVLVDPTTASVRAARL